MQTWLVATVDVRRFGLATIGAVRSYARASLAQRPTDATSARQATPWKVSRLDDQISTVFERIAEIVWRIDAADRALSRHQAGRTSSVHTSRSGSRRSGSPWTTKVSPPTVS